MSVRGRSWLGAFLVAAGVVALAAAALLTRVENGAVRSPTGLFWAGIGLAAVGVTVIIWAFRDVMRQLGQNQSRFEALLRSEVPEKRDEKTSS
jgi:hypothetical protein